MYPNSAPKRPNETHPMSVQIGPGQSDDPAFIELLNSLLQGVVVRRQTEELHVVEFDSWFDHKWLKFRIGSVDVEFPAFLNRSDAARVEIYQDKVTSPPL